MKRIWIPQATAGVMLLWALNPENPYGYYIVLRWVCCAAFTYLALKAHAQGKEGWVWGLGVMAVIYNPIIRIHLTRDIWSAVNIATLIIAVSSIFVIRSPPAPAQGLLGHSGSTRSGEAGTRNPL
jgi:hypothetical protein